MSFKFNWNFFDVNDLQSRCQEALTESIAQTRRPATIVAPIRVVNVSFGSEPPKLKFNSIQAVSLKLTHIVFALKYAGDASLTLETEVQANVLNEPFNDPGFPPFTRPKVLGALSGLQLPLRLTIKNLVLDTLVDVVYTPNGVAVNFHEEPLKSLEVESSLDALPMVHEMMSTMLKKQLTAAFYEDIPESVWTSTNPKRQPPDPFFGARRWSRHLDKFTKLSNYLFSSLAPPSSRGKLKPFFTLSLKTDTPNLAYPRAILSRACLARNQVRSRDDIKPADPPPFEKLDKFLEECSTASSASSINSSLNARLKPKRRVISLRKMTASANPVAAASSSDDTGSRASKGAQSPNGFGLGVSGLGASSFGGYSSSGSNTNGTNSNESTPKRTTAGRTTPHRGSPSGGISPSKSTPTRSSPNRYNLSEDYNAPPFVRPLPKPGTGFSRESSRPASGFSSPRIGSLRTPILKYTDFAAMTDDEEDQFDSDNIACLPPSLNWERRRFSTPEGAQPSARGRLVTKQRTSSMRPQYQQQQPQQPHQSHQQNLASGSYLSAPRSPGRYPSTNDLMTKEKEEK